MIDNFYDFINEMNFDIVPTKFEEVEVLGKFVTSCVDTEISFYTKKKNKYTVYFFITTETPFTKLDDGELLPVGIIPTIAFSETKNKFDYNFFDKLTNKGEFTEVMGKIIYIILYYINNNPQYNVYSIGEVEPKKLKFYSYYKKHLNMFDIKIGDTKNYTDKYNNFTKAYYLIKKDII